MSTRISFKHPLQQHETYYDLTQFNLKFDNREEMNLAEFVERLRYKIGGNGRPTPGDKDDHEAFDRETQSSGI